MTTAVKLLTRIFLFDIMTVSLRHNINIIQEGKMDTIKKICKIVAIVVAIAAAVAGIVLFVKKLKEKKLAEADCEENYVSCSCCEAPVQ